MQSGYNNANCFALYYLTVNQLSHFNSKKSFKKESLKRNTKILNYTIMQYSLKLYF